jgi:uncharacterized lipoprotein
MKTIIASMLVLAAIAGCSSTTETDAPYSNGEAASHNSAL